jgi:hypothetical protein
MDMIRAGRSSKLDRVRQRLDEAKRLRAHAADATTIDLRRRLLTRAMEIEATAAEQDDESSGSARS